MPRGTDAQPDTEDSVVWPDYRFHLSASDARCGGVKKRFPDFVSPLRITRWIVVWAWLAGHCSRRADQTIECALFWLLFNRRGVLVVCPNPVDRQR